jgi:hypothetical protein
MSAYRSSSRSDAQTEASRNNSQLSTGPRTEAGKARSAANSLKHGLTAIHLSTLGPREAELLQEVHLDFEREFNPEGILETDLLRRVADESFRVRQIEKAIESLKLEGMETARKSDPPPGSTGSREDAFLAITADPAFQRRLSLFLRYKGATERAFYRALATLKQTQKERRAEAEAERKAAQKQQHSRSRGFVSHYSKTRLTADPDFPETPPENGRN